MSVTEPEALVALEPSSSSSRLPRRRIRAERDHGRHWTLTLANCLLRERGHQLARLPREVASQACCGAPFPFPRHLLDKLHTLHRRVLEHESKWFGRLGSVGVRK